MSANPVNDRLPVKLKLTNWGDLALQSEGLLKGQPRSLEVEAMIDPHAARLCLKPSVIAVLELRGRLDPVEFELMGRTDICDVLIADEDGPNIVGHIPLHQLDLVVDWDRREVTGNPEHGGERMSEMYFAR